MLFYKNIQHSVVPGRQQSSNPRPVAAEEQIIEDQLLEARRKAKQLQNPKLSAFEKELLQAWFQD